MESEICQAQQDLDQLCINITYASAEGVQRGAYILADADDGKPAVLLLATGSEVTLCIDAYEQLKAESTNAPVVSMPSWETFEASAPPKALQRTFGFTPEAIVAAAKAQVAQGR